MKMIFEKKKGIVNNLKYNGKYRTHITFWEEVGLVKKM